MDLKSIQQKCFDFYQDVAAQAYDLIDSIATEVADAEAWEIYDDLDGISSIEHTMEGDVLIIYDDGTQALLTDLTPDEVLDIVKVLMGFNY